MREDGAAPGTGLTTDAEALVGLGADDWARLLPVLRRALTDVDDERASPVVRRLRAVPAGRLASGAGRADLCRLVVGDPEVRAAVLRRLPDLPEDLRAALAGARPRAGAADPARDPGGDERARRSVAEATRRAERARRRLREVREERDGLARRLDGAQVRAERAEREATAQHRRAEDLEAALGRLRGELADAREEVERAVDRERRRGEARLARLEEQLRELRRRDHEREERQRRRDADEARARRPAEEPGPPPSHAPPGRPTRLPETVARGTAEEVGHLLSRGRMVVVDGYNVTRSHREHLDLATQRDWLVKRLATLAAQRGVRPVVVFDGERSSTSRPPAGARGVEVRFTPAGITADDELVLLVETLDEDEPVLAVTDDRELRERLRARRVDVVGTGPFLWATPG